jgi:hypothetical protein
MRCMARRSVESEVQRGGFLLFESPTTARRRYSRWVVTRPAAKAIARSARYHGIRPSARCRFVHVGKGRQ